MSQRGYNHDYDLSIVDEIFAIFAGITLFVSYTDWLQSRLDIISVIVGSVALTVVAIVVAINKRKFWTRLAFYLLAILLAYIGVKAIMKVSAHDLAPQISALNALPIGVIVWMGIREISVFSMNLFRQKDSDDTSESHSHHQA